MSEQSRSAFAREYVQQLIEWRSGLSFTQHPASYLYLLYGPAFDAEAMQQVWDEIKHRDTFETFADMEAAQFLANRAYACLKEETFLQSAEVLLGRMQTEIDKLHTQRTYPIFYLKDLKKIRTKDDGLMSWLFRFVGLLTQVGSDFLAEPQLADSDIGVVSSGMDEFLRDIIELYCDIHAFAIKLGLNEMVSA